MHEFIRSNNEVKVWAGLWVVIKSSREELMAISTVLEGIKLAVDLGLTPLVIQSNSVIVAIWRLIG